MGLQGPPRPARLHRTLGRRRHDPRSVAAAHLDAIEFILLLLLFFFNLSVSRSVPPPPPVAYVASAGQRHAGRQRQIRGPDWPASRACRPAIAAAAR
jgi:hypothetical protein